MKSKEYSLVVFLLMGFLALAIVNESPAQVELPRVSPKAMVSQTIGYTDVTITYSRPGVKGRQIWGELVPYGEVWRTGANEATTIWFSEPVKVEGNRLDAGTYSLFTIPGKDEWTVIFNENDELWGAFGYEEDKDVLRIKTTPQKAPHQEWMLFAFQDLRQNAATVVLRWAELEVPFAITTDVESQVVSKMQAAMANLKADDWRTAWQCASYSLNNDMMKDEAKGWLDKSIKIKETFWNTRTKAEMFADEGDYKQAVEWGNKAVEIGSENAPPEELNDFKKELQEWNSKI